MKKFSDLFLGLSFILLLLPLSTMADDLFPQCGEYSLSGKVDCVSSNRCYLYLWKGSLSERKFLITKDLDNALLLNGRKIKTRAKVLKLNPFKVIIGGSFIPSLEEDTVKDLKLAKNLKCTE